MSEMPDIIFTVPSDENYRANKYLADPNACIFADPAQAQKYHHDRIVQALREENAEKDRKISILRHTVEQDERSLSIKDARIAELEDFILCEVIRTMNDIRVTSIKAPVTREKIHSMAQNLSMSCNKILNHSTEVLK